MRSVLITKIVLRSLNSWRTASTAAHLLINGHADVWIGVYVHVIKRVAHQSLRGFQLVIGKDILWGKTL
jgi:hypothetical protein